MIMGTNGIVRVWIDDSVVHTFGQAPSSRNVAIKIAMRQRYSKIYDLKVYRDCNFFYFFFTNTQSYKIFVYTMWGGSF